MIQCFLLSWQVQKSLSKKTYYSKKPSQLINGWERVITVFIGDCFWCNKFAACKTLRENELIATHFARFLQHVIFRQVQVAKWWTNFARICNHFSVISENVKMKNICSELDFRFSSSPFVLTQKKLDLVFLSNDYRIDRLSQKSIILQVRWIWIHFLRTWKTTTKKLQLYFYAYYFSHNAPMNYT